MANNQSDSAEYLNGAESAELARFDLAYGARAKQAAAHLGELVGMSEEANRQFIDGLDSVMNQGARFEERRDVAAHFNAIAGILGRHTLGSAGQSQELTIVKQSSTRQATPSNNPQTHEAAPDTASKSKEELIKLSTHHNAWLAKTLGDDNAELIMGMGIKERKALVARIGVLYRSVAIARHPDKVKDKRINGFDTYLKNSSFADISRLIGMTPQGVSKSFESMFEVLREFPEDALDLAISGKKQDASDGTSTNSDTTESLPGNTEDVPDELSDTSDQENANDKANQADPDTKIDNEGIAADIDTNRETVLLAQKKWLGKIYGADYGGIPALMRMNSDQTTYFITQLSPYIQSYYERREPAPVTARRVNEIQQLLVAGNLPPRMAPLYRQSAVVVSGELHQTAVMLKERVDAKTLVDIAETSKQFTSGDE